MRNNYIPADNHESLCTRFFIWKLNRWEGEPFCTDICTLLNPRVEQAISLLQVARFEWREKSLLISLLSLLGETPRTFVADDEVCCWPFLLLLPICFCSVRLWDRK